MELLRTIRTPVYALICLSFLRKVVDRILPVHPVKMKMDDDKNIWFIRTDEGHIMYLCSVPKDISSQDRAYLYEMLRAETKDLIYVQPNSTLKRGESQIVGVGPIYLLSGEYHGFTCILNPIERQRLYRDLQVLERQINGLKIC